MDFKGDAVGKRGGDVEVVKLRPDGRIRIRYRGRAALASQGVWALETRWAGPPWLTGPAPMHPGDPCVEFFRPGGCLVILKLMDPAGELKGFYADMAAPVRQEEGVWRYRDLVLDAFVAPDGSLRLLDGEEFLDWVRSGARPDEVRWAVDGLAELFDRWQNRRLPFDGATPAAEASTPGAESGGPRP